MDEESGLWPFLSRLFGAKNGHSIERRIEEAAQEGELKADEMVMLLNVLRLGRKQVFDIMIPRTDIVCAEVDDTLHEVMQKIVASGHSRIPIYKENRDNIMGILYAKDLLKVLSDEAEGLCEAEPPSLQEFMREPFFVPETKNVKELIQEFRSRKVHLAIALDEYGGTSGLVTLEDLLEEIVGEIEDEYDAPRPEEVQRLGEGRYLVSGRTMLEDLAQETGLELESEQVETVGGYLSELAGRVPRQGEVFRVQGWRFEVKEADAKQLRFTVMTLDDGAGGRYESATLIPQATSDAVRPSNE
ncbi:hemolysin family protein [Megalodesulfovibrio paquesii]